MMIFYNAWKMSVPHQAQVLPVWLMRMATIGRFMSLGRILILNKTIDLLPIQ